MTTIYKIHCAAGRVAWGGPWQGDQGNSLPYLTLTSKEWSSIRLPIRAIDVSMLGASMQSWNTGMFIPRGDDVFKLLGEPYNQKNE